MTPTIARRRAGLPGGAASAALAPFAAFAALTMLALPAGAAPAPYPTVDRVEYVLECMKNNGGSHEYLYKCSCTIDAIAEQLPYADYVEAATVARYQTLGGERGGLFRDPEPMQALAKRYRGLQAEAKQGCGVPR